MSRGYPKRVRDSGEITGSNRFDGGTVRGYDEWSSHMAKLVILNQGLVGFACELVAEKTTIGRATDNTFRIPEISVSRHHCAILQRGGDVVVADLDSSNG